MNNMRKTLIAVAIATVAVSAFAQLSPQFSDWGKGPVQFLMTPEEQTRWKSIRNDAEASAFVDLFWARRDPTPGTPRNEYKENFDTAVKYADERFTAGRTKGSLSDRGKVLILFGPPKAIQRSSTGPTSGNDDRGFSSGDSVSASTSSASEKSGKQVWIYEGDQAQKGFSAPRAEVDLMDQFNTGDYRIQRGKVDIPSAQANVIRNSIVQPGLTEAPKYNAAPAAAAPAAVSVPVAPVAPAAPSYPTTFKTATYQTAVSDFEAAKASPYKNLYVSWGEFVTPQGEYFVPVQLYVPKGANLTGSEELTFFGVVEDGTGKPIAVFEEPAKLSVTKDDLYFDKSLTLPAGKHKGVFGLAQGGKPISMVQADMNLTGTLDKDAPAVSNLILSNNVYPLASAQKPNDPYAFGGIKVVPKGDKTFRQSDEVWYFFELRNPGLDETNQPKIQVKLDVEGNVGGQKTQRSSPPRMQEAQELKGVPGHFGIGSSIPLSTFKPGDYVLKVKITDTIKKAVYNLSESFKVIGEGK
jgi:GWxTD domain-containing protein